MLSRLRSAHAIDALIAAAISAGVLAALLATSRDFAMVFDEGFTVDREITLADWFAGIADPGPGLSRSDYLRPEVLEQFWRFSRKEPDGHPPFYALIGLAGWRVARGWTDSLTSYRFGPMALAAATSGLIYLFLARRFGRLAGVTGSLALVLAPRTFAHAHYAHYDMPVTCLWLLAQMAFVKAVRSPRRAVLSSAEGSGREGKAPAEPAQGADLRPGSDGASPSRRQGNGPGSPRWIVAFGVLLGLAAGTKFTGWFAVVPAMGWWAIFEGRPMARRVLRHFRLHGSPRLDRPPPAMPPGLPATRALALGIPLAALTLYAIQPAWWASPWRGLDRFLVSNLTREQSVPVTSLYLGTVYRFALPWHNTIVLTAVTMPVTIVVLGLVGIAAVLARARSDRESLIWPMSWAVLMVVRALPNAPGHDVERLLLPSLASLSLLSGIGAGWLAGWLRSSRLGRAMPIVAAVVVGECLLGIAQVYPYNLSYYSVAVGGLPGAERLGFEETYYCDTQGPEFLGWVRRTSKERPLELSFPLGLVNIMILRDWGVFPLGVKVARLDSITHPDHVLQRNRGIYAPHDWWLERHGHPIFVIRRQGVEILRVYPNDEVVKAERATRGQPGVLESSERPTWGLR